MEVGHAGGQDIALPGDPRQRGAPKLFHDPLQGRSAPVAPILTETLPAEEEIGERGERHRLHLAAQDRQGGALDLLEQMAVAELKRFCAIC